MTPVKLVHVTTVPEALWFFIGQVSYMKHRGIEVHAVSSPGHLVKPFTDSEQVPFHPINMHRRITPLKDMHAVYALYNLFHHLKPHIVQVQTFKAAFVGMIAAWLARTPVRIYNCNGLLLMTARPRDRFIFGVIERMICRLATCVWCVSHSVREVMIAQKLCPASKVKVLRSGTVNGVDSLIRFNPANVPVTATRDIRMKYAIPLDAKLVAFIGRMVRDKGIVELAEAWKQVASTHPDAHLLLVGPREPRDPVPEEVWQEMTSHPRVHVEGLVLNNQIPAYLAAIDILVLPTYREGFPVVPLEAGSMEVPVVLTRIPGCIDAVVDGVTGTVVAPADAVDLARAIKRYLDNSDLRRKHGAAARRRVIEEFAQEPLWESIYQEYCSQLNGARRPHPAGTGDPALS